MTKQSAHHAMLALLTFLLIPIASLAQFPGDGPRQQPFQAAIEACQNKAAGDSVEFTNRRGDTVVATCTLVAVPNEPQRKGKMGDRQRDLMKDNKMGKGGFRAMLVQKLDLTAEQQAQLNQMRTSHREENMPQREALQAERMELHQAMMAKPFDEAKLRAIIQKQSQMRADMMVENARFREQLFAILTPEQQQKWEQLPHPPMMDPPAGPEDQGR